MLLLLFSSGLVLVYYGLQARMYMCVTFYILLEVVLLELVLLELALLELVLLEARACITV